MKNVFIPALAAITLSCFSCSQPASKTTVTADEVQQDSTANSLSTAEKDSGYVLLFDGKTTTGWRGYNKPAFPKGWIIEDGCLKSLGTAQGDTGGDIIYAADSFEHFELLIDWKISQGGNSGIFYRVVENPKYHAPYETAPEYQLIDDIGYPGKLEDWQKTACDYAMYLADSNKLLQPAGTWNQTKIVVRQDSAFYYLNGKQTVAFAPFSADWLKRRNSGKWEAYPDYGIAKKGMIALQDHGSFIWFKNIKLRKL